MPHAPCPPCPGGGGNVKKGLSLGSLICIYFFCAMLIPYVPLCR